MKPIGADEKFRILLGNRITDIHRPLGKDMPLNNIFYIEEERKVNNDWTISYKGILYQIKKQYRYHPHCKGIAQVRKDIEGNISVFYKKFSIEYTILKQKKNRIFLLWYDILYY
jgi:hypothetical protein